MSLLLWLLLALLILLACAPPLLALIGVKNGWAGKVVKFAPALYLGLGLAFAISYIFSFPRMLEDFIPPGGSTGVEFDMVTPSGSLSCIRASDRLNKIQQASRGTVVYRGGNELRVASEIWRQMPVDARIALGDMVASSALCDRPQSRSLHIIIRDLNSDRIIYEGDAAGLQPTS